MNRAFKAIIMGAPGSGKGTISSRTVKDFGLKHLSSGDLLRAQIQKKTEAGLAAEKYIHKGQLVPDTIVAQLMLNELQRLKGDNWLLDGFPRTVQQAKILHSHEPAEVVISLEVPFDIIINRIKGRWTHESSGRIYHTEFNPPIVPGKDDVTGEALIQRDDDKPETVLSRLENYQKLTAPVLDFYRKLGLLTVFRGKYSNEIWPQVQKFLSTKIIPRQYTHYGV